jgi:two-component system, OmpR family, response regulator
MARQEWVAARVERAKAFEERAEARSNRMHLLVIEDDPKLGRLLSRMLGDDHHVVELATNGRDGVDLAELGGLDAIILDIGLPDIDGFTVASRIRARGDGVPILMLTARDAIHDRVRGLDAGADDYLVKPFAFEELAARLRALGRRRVVEARPTPSLVNGPISLDETKRAVYVDARPVALTPREFALLECFLRHPGAVLTRDQLLDAAWPYGVAVTPNTVDAYVHLLREKLGPAGGARIRTERGVGYRMAEA